MATEKDSSAETPAAASDSTNNDDGVSRSNSMNMKSQTRSRPKMRRINSNGTLDSVESSEEERILQAKKEQKKKRSKKKPSSTDNNARNEEEIPKEERPKRTKPPPKNKSMISDVTVEERRRAFEANSQTNKNHSDRSMGSTSSETSSSSKRSNNSYKKQQSKRSLIRRNKSLSSAQTHSSAQNLLRQKSDRSLQKDQLRRRNSFSLRNNQKPTRAYSDRNLNNSRSNKNPRRSSLPSNPNSQSTTPSNSTTLEDHIPDVSVMTAVDSPFEEPNSNPDNNTQTPNKAPPLTRENNQRRRRSGLLSKSMATETSVQDIRQRFEKGLSDKKLEKSSRHLLELEGSESHVMDLVTGYESVSSLHLSPQGKPSPQRPTRKMSKTDVEAFRRQQKEQQQQLEDSQNSMTGLIAEPIVPESAAEYKDHWFSHSEPLPTTTSHDISSSRAGSDKDEESVQSIKKEQSTATTRQERPKLKDPPKEFTDDSDQKSPNVPQRFSESKEDARRSSMSAFSSLQEEETKLRRQRRTGRRRSSMSASASSADKTDKERRRGSQEKSRRKISRNTKKLDRRDPSSKSPKSKRSKSRNISVTSVDSMDSGASFGIKTNKKPVIDPSWTPKVKEMKKTLQERLEKKRHTLAAPSHGKSKKSRKEWLKEHKRKKKDAAPAPPPRTLLNVQQRSIDVDDLNYVAPFFERSRNESKMIKKTLSKMVDLATLPSANVNKLVAAFESLSYKAGSEIQTVEDDEEYFYIIQDGQVDMNVDGQAVGQASSGQTFGDTHLFHSAKEMSQMVAKTDTKVLRIDQTTYRAIMQAERKRVDRDKYWLVKNSRVFHGLSDKQRKTVANALKPISFKKGEIIKNKGDTNHGLYIVASGQLTYRHAYEQTLEKGQHGCEEALFWSEQFLEKLSPTEMEGKKNGICYFLDRQTFEGIMGKARNVLLSQERANILHQVEALQPSRKKALTVEQMATLISKMEERYYNADDIIFDGNGEDAPAALYFIEHGTVAEVQGRFLQIHIENSIIGQDAFRAARKRGKTTTETMNTIKAKTACVVGILKLEDYLSILPETSQSAKKDKTPKDKAPKSEESKDNTHVYKLENLERKKVLGEGQFGQVWLVSDKTETTKRSYALKIQSKFELLDQGQAEGCVREKNVMLEMDFPFVIKLYATFMDKNFVYLYVLLHSH